MFQYEIIINRDMKDLYKEVLNTFDNFPMFILMNELEDGSDLLCHLFKNDRQLFYIKNASDDVIVKVIKDRIRTGDYKTLPALKFEENNLENYEIRKWIQVICLVADILDVECPQILFTHDEDAGTAAGAMIVIPDALSDVETLISISHELRHVWQYKHHPEWSDDYIHPEDDLEGYLFQKAELDAEAFARRFVARVLDIDDRIYSNTDPKMEQRLFNTAMSMNLVEFFSKKKEIENLRKLIKQ